MASFPRTPSRTFLFRTALSAVAMLLIGWLGVAVVRCGYTYQYDTDELYHLQVVYEMAHGAVPYLSFLFPYTPLLHWLLLPTVWLTHAGEATMLASRAVMSGLFAVRMAAVFGIGMMLFGWWGSLLLTALTLIDPFTTFTGMQIRPDNIAVFLQTAAVLAFLAASAAGRGRWWMAFGLASGLSVLSSLKTAPSLGVLALAAIAATAKTPGRLRILILSFTAPVAVFMLYWMRLDALPQMVQGVLGDAKAINDSLVKPIPLVNFYWPENWFLYGFSKPSPLWYFELFIPMSAMYGMVTVLTGHGRLSRTPGLRAVAAASLAQFLSLPFVRSVFLQYFLPVNWLLVVFSAYLWVDIVGTAGQRNRRAGWAAAGTVAAACGILIWFAAGANAARAGFGTAVQMQYLTGAWDVVPDTARVFPGLLYRRNGSYLGYAWNWADLPATVRDRIPLTRELSDPAVTHVYLNGVQLAAMPDGVRAAIAAGYDQVPYIGDVWVRKSSSGR